MFQVFASNPVAFVGHSCSLPLFAGSPGSVVRGTVCSLELSDKKSRFRCDTRRVDWSQPDVSLVRVFLHLMASFHSGIIRLSTFEAFPCLLGQSPQRFRINIQIVETPFHFAAAPVHILDIPFPPTILGLSSQSDQAINHRLEFCNFALAHIVEQVQECPQMDVHFHSLPYVQVLAILPPCVAPWIDVDTAFGRAFWPGSC